MLNCNFFYTFYEIFLGLIPYVIFEQKLVAEIIKRILKWFRNNKLCKKKLFCGVHTWKVKHHGKVQTRCPDNEEIFETWRSNTIKMSKKYKVEHSSIV